MIDRLLSWMLRHATTVLAAGVFLGLAAPPLAGALRPFLFVSVFVLLATTFYRLDWRAVGGYARRPGLTAIIAIGLLVMMPIVVAAVVFELGLRTALATALVLNACGPPILSSIPFAHLLRLDPALAAMTVFTTTILAPLTIPLMAVKLIGIDLDIGVAAFMLRLVLLAVGALVVAGLLRMLVPRQHQARVERAADGLLVVFLLVFAVAIMDGVTAALLDRPVVVLDMAIAAFAINISLQVVGAGVSALLGPRRSLTIGMMNGNRNMALILAALAGSADVNVLLYMAVGQLPIYVLPALLAPLYRRLCRVFGEQT
jgi:BASS family bile acid:Na+ symporter